MRTGDGKSRLSRLRKEDTRERRVRGQVDEKREGAGERTQSKGGKVLSKFKEVTPFVRFPRWSGRDKRIIVGVRVTLDKLKDWLRGS